MDYVNIRRKKMLPSREQAMKILEEANACNPGPWRDHSLVTAKCAEYIADECDGMDAGKAYILGLLHDIGRKFGVGHLSHVIDGYYYMMELGYEEAAKVCITHSFNIKDINMYIGNQDVSAAHLQEIIDLLESYEYDDYDLLIQLCDSVALPEGPVDIEVRMGDVKKRYGRYPKEKWMKSIEIKEYFEAKMGKSISDVTGSFYGGREKAGTAAFT